MPEVQSSRVLVLAPVGRDAPMTVEILRAAGLAADICLDLGALLVELGEGAGAIFVAEEALFGKDLGALTAWIRRQPAWSELPFIVLTSRRDEPVVVRWRGQLADLLRNVTFLERPVRTITLSSALASAVRARTRQYEVRSLLAARENAAARLEGEVAKRTHELGEANAQLKRQMAERAEMEESRRQAQKVEAIGQLTGGIAHDFNNLLMVITGGLSLLRATKDAERRDHIIEGMRHAAERGSTLTGQLLSFARKKSLKAEPVDLRQQISAMSELLDRTLRGDVDVELRFPDDLWPVHVDPTELELVLLNLCVNARDAMPRGGTIVIEARNLAAAASDTGTAAPVGDFVRLAVTDSGTGMSAEVQKKAFDPFFTTKEIGRGSGLGLPQVQGFAQQSGGSVEIDSVVGRGTTIALLLPRSLVAPPDLEVAPHPVSSDASDSHAAGTVLLVEDDNAVAALVDEMMNMLGWRIVRAATAAEALGVLDGGECIDLVFSDVMMPGGMSGVELAGEIRRHRPDLPILLTTGFAAGIADVTRAHNLTVLNKPYRLDELEQALQDVLRVT